MFFNKPRYNLARNQRNVQQSIDIAMRSNMSIRVNNSLIESMLATNTLGMTPEDAKLESERLRGLNAVNQTINEASRLNLLYGRKIDDNNNRMIAEPTVQDSISKLADQLTSKKDKKIILPQNLSRFQRYVDIGHDQKLRGYRNPNELVLIDMNKDEFIAVSKTVLVGKGISEGKIEDMLNAIVWNKRYIIISFEHSFGSKFNELNNKLTMVKPTEDRWGKIIDGANKADIGVGQQVALPKDTNLSAKFDQMERILKGLLEEKGKTEDERIANAKNFVGGLNSAVNEELESDVESFTETDSSTGTSTSGSFVDMIDDETDEAMGKIESGKKEGILDGYFDATKKVLDKSTPEAKKIINKNLQDQLLVETNKKVKREKELKEAEESGVEASPEKVDLGKYTIELRRQISNDLKSGFSSKKTDRQAWMMGYLEHMMVEMIKRGRSWNPKSRGLSWKKLQRAADKIKDIDNIAQDPDVAEFANNYTAQANPMTIFDRDVNPPKSGSRKMPEYIETVFRSYVDIARILDIPFGESTTEIKTREAEEKQKKLTASAERAKKKSAENKKKKEVVKKKKGKSFKKVEPVKGSDVGAKFKKKKEEKEEEITGEKQELIREMKKVENRKEENLKNFNEIKDVIDAKKNVTNLLLEKSKVKNGDLSNNKKKKRNKEINAEIKRNKENTSNFKKYINKSIQSLTLINLGNKGNFNRAVEKLAELNNEFIRRFG